MLIDQILYLVATIVVLVIALYILYRIFYNIRKKQLAKQSFVTLCPNCGNPSGTPSNITLPGMAFLGGISPGRRYKCANCDYEGPYVEVDKEKINDFMKHIKKKSK